MDTHRFTSDRFDREKGIHHTLRYGSALLPGGHNFELKDIEKVREITSALNEHVKHITGRNLGADNFDIGMKYLKEKHKGFKNLPPHQQRDFEAALKKEIRVVEPEQEEAV